MEKTAKEWTEGMICPVVKIRRQKICADCTGIALLNVTFKVLPSLTQKRLEMVEHNVHEYQMGFRPSRLTMENIHTIRQTYEKCYIIKWTYIIYLLMTNRLLTDRKEVQQAKP